MARPTKYRGKKTIAQVDAITKSLTLKTFLDACSVDHIACALGVCRETIRIWMKTYPAFLGTMKKWETKRNKLFYPFSFGKQMAPGVWVFLAKNWLEMTDREQNIQTNIIQGTGDMKITIVHTREDDTEFLKEFEDEINKGDLTE